MSQTITSNQSVTVILTDQNTTIAPGVDISVSNNNAVYGRAGAQFTVVNYGVVSATGFERDGIVLTSPGVINNDGFIGGKYRGIYLKSGGSISNQSNSTITGGTAIRVSSAAATIDNAGLISGTIGASNFGIVLYTAYGTSAITNQSSGVITAVYRGIESFESLTNIVNAGHISGGNAGIFLNISGNITNQSSGVVTGKYSGIHGGAGGLTLYNQGLITTAGKYGAGVQVRNGSTVAGGITNAPGGMISSTGAQGYGVFVASNAAESLVNYGVITGNTGVEITSDYAFSQTVTNFGTISSTNNTSDDAVLFGSAGDELRVAPGAVFNGLIVGNASTLDLMAGSKTGTLGGLGGTGDSISGFTSINFDAGAAWTISGNVNGLASGQAISGFAAGDTIELTGVAYNANDQAVVGTAGIVTLVAGGTNYQFDIVNATVGESNFVITGNNGKTALSLACFASGTRIATPGGEVAVEDLCAGMVVSTLDGPCEIKWVGQRFVDIARHARPALVRPVCIQAGAIADGLPVRDLVVSPDHALFLDGVLVPAKALLNGYSIYQMEVGHVTYHHVELQAHGAVFANGVAAESYLDTGNRDGFEGAASASALHPDFGQGRREAEGFAPFAEAGAVVEGLRQRLLDRAGIETCYEPDVAVLSAGGEAVISSRWFVPGEIFADPRDRRRLGVKVAALILDGRRVAVDHPLLREGWHEVEHDGRWTDGAAIVPAGLLDGAVDVRVEMVAAGIYPVARVGLADAA